MHATPQLSDEWLPEVTLDGQTYYVSAHTGQYTRQLPQEPVASTPPKSRLRPGTNQSYIHDVFSASPESNYGTPLRSGSPASSMFSPDHHVSHDHRGGPRAPRPLPVPTPEAISRKGSGTNSSTFSPDRGSSSFRPLSLRSTSLSRSIDFEEDSSSSHHYSSAETSPDLQDFSDELKAASSPEEAARLLQQALSPSPPELIVDLSDTAHKAIQSLVTCIRSSRRPRNTVTSERVHNLVVAIRNLLYVSTIPFGRISKIPGVSSDRPTDSSLREASHRVTALLSKFVLPTLLSRRHSDYTMEEAEDVSKDLEQALDEFVSELQQKQAFLNQLIGESGIRRLHGVFSTANINPWVAGAGSAGSWSGFGWVTPQNEEGPSRPFGPQVVLEIQSSIAPVTERLDSLADVLYEGSAALLASEGQGCIARLSAFLPLLTDIQLAQHLDGDGRRCDEVQDHNRETYIQSVANAKALVRMLEATVQSLFDDGSSLFQAVQQLRISGIISPARPQIDIIVISLKANLELLSQTVEDLLSASFSQIEMITSNRQSIADSISSRLSIVDGVRFDPISPLNFGLAPGNDTGEDAQNQGTMDLRRSLILLGKSGLHLNGSNFVGGAPGKRDVPPIITGMDRYTEDLTTPDDFTSPLFEDDPVASTRTPLRGEKLRQILGDEAPRCYIDDLRPWYMRPNHTDADLIIDGHDSVKGGTIQALVERLTSHDQADPMFQEAFLMTFRSFTNIDELFDLLVQRFNIQPPENLKLQEYQQWTTLKQRVIQFRVLNTFKSIVSDEDILEKEDTSTLQRIQEFVSREDVVCITAAKQLLALIERTRKNGDSVIKTMNRFLHPRPSPILPKNQKKLELLDIDPIEMARQLTIVESELYMKIKPNECLQRAREFVAGDTNDNIACFNQTFDRIASWVTDCVLAKDNSRARASVIKHFILVADRCREINNFSSMVAITSGLMSTPIRRLKRTWEQVHSRHTTQLSTCEVITDPRKNFSNYHSTLAKVTPPCVPFIGVYLTSLTFIQEGNKDSLPGNLINFRKRQKTVEIIQGIKRWQSIPFNFHPVPSISSYIETALLQFQDQTGLADKFWNLSLQREPRERDDERMVRLLEESGFC